MRNTLFAQTGHEWTATITTNVVQNVIAVPLQAIVTKKPDASPSPTIQGNSPETAEKPKPIEGVYVLEGNKVKFVPIEKGITGESDIQIISGLSADQE